MQTAQQILGQLLNDAGTRTFHLTYDVDKSGGTCRKYQARPSVPHVAIYHIIISPEASRSGFVADIQSITPSSRIAGLILLLALPRIAAVCSGKRQVRASVWPGACVPGVVSVRICRSLARWERAGCGVRLPRNTVRRGPASRRRPH